ncbi:PHP domain-containing protein [Dehalobacter sp. DCM]|uniref:PHP domain-containing protein n=1 Tax=Dehalobacter sp. DCM TaxID=2907827 RepID=UPI003081F259|nr:PHP domain-containing protein [Dehalobacter sp. DCM]
MIHTAKYEADLHCHTTESDGVCTPAQVVRQAWEVGLKAVAITDHDTISGWSEAEKAGKQYHITVLKGIEINTDWEGREVHILGYALNANDDNLATRLSELREKRVQRIKKMIGKLSQCGVDIAFEDVLKHAEGDSIGRPHIAQALIEKKVVDNVHIAFDKYLKIGRPAYVPRNKLDPAEAIRIIRDAGGVAVVAHPGSFCTAQEISQWVKVGLQGIEVFHPENSADDRWRLTKIAKQNGLIITGGSDYHGHSVKPGINLGDWGVGMNVIKEIEQRSSIFFQQKD